MAFRKFVTLSFDDSSLQDRRLIELFDRYGLKGTFNLNSGLLGKEESLLREGQRVDHTFIPAEEVAALYQNHEIAAHTLTHPLLTSLSEEEIVHQVADDQKALEALSGREVIGLAYPCGGKNYDEMVIQTLEKETTIRYARTIVASNKFDVPMRFLEWHPTCHVMQDNLFELADVFDKAEPEQDMLFYIWGHSFEFDLGTGRWERMEDFCRRLSAMEGVSFVTNRGAYEALSDR